VAGLVLAAGAGTRYRPGFKLLLPHGGEPLVRVVARTALEAGLRPVLTVTGHRAPDVEEALADTGVRTVRNPDPDRGQASSLARGIGVLRSTTDAAAVAVLLADEPGLEVGTVRRAADVWRRDRPAVLRVRYRDRPGHPVVFARRCFDELERLEGEGGARAWIAARASGEGDVRTLEIARDGPIDVDTRSDHTRALRTRAEDRPSGDAEGEPERKRAEEREDAEGDAGR